MAANALPTYTGLAPQCSNFAQAAAVAAAATQGTALDAACPAARQLACSQAQLRPDTQAQQSSAFALWPVNATGGSAGSPVVWRPPSGSIAGRPAKLELSLEGGTPPAFTYGPAFPADMRGGSSFGMQFALDKPALLIYAGEKWEGGGGDYAGRVSVSKNPVNGMAGCPAVCPLTSTTCKHKAAAHRIQPPMRWPAVGHRALLAHISTRMPCPPTLHSLPRPAHRSQRQGAGPGAHRHWPRASV